MKPTTAPTNRLAAAFDNPTDPGKVGHLAYTLLNGGTLPPIEVYTATVDENDLGNPNLLLSGEPVTETLLGETLYYIEDGYHRACAHQLAGLDTILVLIYND